MGGNISCCNGVDCNPGVAYIDMEDDVQPQRLMRSSKGIRGSTKDGPEELPQSLMLNDIEDNIREHKMTVNSEAQLNRGAALEKNYGDLMLTKKDVQ